MSLAYYSNYFGHSARSIKGILQSVRDSHHFAYTCKIYWLCIVIVHKYVNRVRHWRMHVRTSYVCPMVFDYPVGRGLLTSQSQLLAKIPPILAFFNKSNPHDCSKRFTHYFPGRSVQSNTISTSLGSIQPHAAINARRLLVHISTSVYSQVLIYTAEWTGAM